MPVFKKVVFLCTYITETAKTSKKGKQHENRLKHGKKYVYSLNTGKMLVSSGLFWLNVRFKILNLGILAHLRHIARFWARVGEGKASRGYMVKTPQFSKKQKNKKIKIKKNKKNRKKLRISIVRIIFALHNIRHIRFF